MQICSVNAGFLGPVCSGREEGMGEQSWGGSTAEGESLSRSLELQGSRGDSGFRRAWAQQHRGDLRPHTWEALKQRNSQDLRKPWGKSHSPWAHPVRIFSMKAGEAQWEPQESRDSTLTPALLCRRPSAAPSHPRPWNIKTSCIFWTELSNSGWGEGYWFVQHSAKLSGETLEETSLG